MTTSTKRLAGAGLKVSVTLVALVWLARQIEPSAVGSALSRLDAATVAAAFGLLLGHVAVLAWRWVRVVDHLGARLPFGEALRWTFVGLFFNQALPSSVGGDAVRVWALHRRGSDMGTAFGSVAIERGTGLVVVAMLVSAATLTAVPQAGNESIWLPLAAVGPVSALALLALAALGGMLAPVLPNGMTAAVRGLSTGLALLARRPWRLAELCALAAMASLLNFGAGYVIGRTLDLGIHPWAFVALAGGASLMAVLPISLGGWGVREASMVLLMLPSGAPAEAVIACSVLWGLLPAAISAPATLLTWATVAPARVALREGTGPGVPPGGAGSQ